MRLVLDGDMEHLQAVQLRVGHVLQPAGVNDERDVPAGQDAEVQSRVQTAEIQTGTHLRHRHHLLQGGRAPVRQERGLSHPPSLETLQVKQKIQDVRVLNNVVRMLIYCQRILMGCSVAKQRFRSIKMNKLIIVVAVMTQLVFHIYIFIC